MSSGDRNVQTSHVLGGIRALCSCKYGFKNTYAKGQWFIRQHYLIAKVFEKVDF